MILRKYFIRVSSSLLSISVFFTSLMSVGVQSGGFQFVNAQEESIVVTSASELYEAVDKASKDSSTPTKILVAQDFSIDDSICFGSISNGYAIPYYVSIESEDKNDIKVISRSTGFTDNMFVVNYGSQLTLSNIVLDGNKNEATDVVGSEVCVLYSTLVLNEGIVLKNNKNDTHGGAIFNGSGIVYMNAGDIYDNESNRGGGLFNAGQFIMKSGSINNNIVTDIIDDNNVVRDATGSDICYSAGRIRVQGDSVIGGIYLGGDDISYEAEYLIVSGPLLGNITIENTDGLGADRIVAKSCKRDYYCPDYEMTQEDFEKFSSTINDFEDLKFENHEIYLTTKEKLIGTWIIRFSHKFGEWIIRDATKFNSWIQDEYGNWYYFNEKGFMLTGWHNDILSPAYKNKWFYFNEDGVMQTGWCNNAQGYQGKWFYFNEDGTMKTGWCNNTKGYQGKWFYFNEDGTMKTGWCNNIQGWGSNWFYFNEDGTMAQNQWVKINSDWYYLLENGVMLINGYTPDGYKVDYTGRCV